jgi:hypothetical protein
MTDTTAVETTKPPKPPVAAAPAPAAEPKRYRIHSRQVCDVSRHSEGTHWRVIIEPTMPYEEILKEETWAWATTGQHGEMRPGNYIEVHPADLAWEVLLFVREVTGGGLVLGLCRKTEFAPRLKPTDLEHGGFKLAWDALQKHHIVRKKDNQVMSSGYKSQASAHVAMIELSARR